MYLYVYRYIKWHWCPKAEPYYIVLAQVFILKIQVPVDVLNSLSRKTYGNQGQIQEFLKGGGGGI